MVMLFCIVSSASVTNFFPTVVQTLGYGRVPSLLLTAPPYVLAVITAFINAWHADRTGERYFHITLPLYIAVIAFIIAAATTTTAPRYLAMMLMPPGIYTGKQNQIQTTNLHSVHTLHSSFFIANFSDVAVISAGYVVALGWISNCMPRPPAKRAAALAAINAVSNTSSIYASYMFPLSAGPRYGKSCFRFESTTPAVTATSQFCWIHPCPDCDETIIS
jgi:MFS family permease